MTQEIDYMEIFKIFKKKFVIVFVTVPVTTNRNNSFCQTRWPVKKRDHDRDCVCTYSLENTVNVIAKVTICNTNATAQVCIHNRRQ